MKYKCFVAMTIGRTDTDDVFDGVMLRVARTKDIEARRVDRLVHNDDIDDKIIEEIKNADLVIADLTYARPSVYFEAGYAERAGTPVIYTCRRDHLLRAADDGLRVHFDLEHRNIIAWDNASDTRFSDELSLRFDLLLRDLVEAERTLMGSSGDWARQFRDARLAKVAAGKGARPLSGQIKSILHVVPPSAADSTFRLDLDSVDSHEGKCRRLHALGWQSAGYNPDGFLFRGGLSDSAAGRYLQLFRNGAVEDAYSQRVETVEYRSATPILYVGMGDLETRCREVLPAIMDSLRQFGVEPPMLVMYALCGVNGLIVGRPDWTMCVDGLLTPMTEDTLVVQGRVVQSFDTDVDALLHPIFDEAWNASGRPGSPSWDSSHKWLGG